MSYSREHLGRIILDRDPRVPGTGQDWECHRVIAPPSIVPPAYYGIPAPPNYRPGPFHPRRPLGALGLTPDEARTAANTQAVTDLYNSIEGTAENTIEKYGDTFDKLADLGKVIQSGGDFTSQLNAAYEAAASVASLFPVYGTAISVLLRVMEGLTNWIAEAVPHLPDSCNTAARQAAQHYYNAKFSRVLSPEDAEFEVYQNLGMLCCMTVIYRRYSSSSYDMAPGCFYPWNDYPMFPRPTTRPGPPMDCRVETSGDYSGVMICTGEGYTGGSDASLRNSDLTLRLIDGTTLDQKRVLLETACRPKRKVVGVPPRAGGYLSWYQYLYDHPDEEGTRAAFAAGKAVVDKLYSDGGAEYMGWGYDRDSIAPWGDRSWISAVFFSVKGLDDPTLVHILNWFSQLGDTVLPVGVRLPEEIALIRPNPDPTVGGWAWTPGLALYLEDWMFNQNPQYLPYHYAALLQEYKRRKREGIFTLGPADEGKYAGQGAGAGKVLLAAAGIAAVGGLAWLLFRK